MKQSIWPIFRAARERKHPPAVPYVQQKVEPVMADSIKTKTPKAIPTGRRLTIRSTLAGKIVFVTFEDHSVISKTIIRQWIKAGKIIKIGQKHRFRIFGNEYYVSEYEVAK